MAAGEACDDGNDIQDDGCNNMCLPGTCGNGIVEDAEECDDGNDDQTDGCASCMNASCGDGFVQEGVEECDDGNEVETDACLGTCTAATCGDGQIQEGVEECDDGNDVSSDDCAACSSAVCGDGFLQEGVEDCDDGNTEDDDGCSSSCEAECANPGGGNLTAENGTNMDVLYCYNQGDSNEVRAEKACESHFGIGACCIIPSGYNGEQYGECDQGGGNGTFHWHPDNHPNGHCAPDYVVGEVVSPGWCGTLLGSFLD